MGARQGRVPFALHRKLVDLVAQCATRYPVDHGRPSCTELATLDIPERGLQLLLGVGPPATPGTHHGDTTDACRGCCGRRHGRHRPGHTWFRAVTRTENIQTYTVHEALFSRVVRRCYQFAIILSLVLPSLFVRTLRCTDRRPDNYQPPVAAQLLPRVIGVGFRGTQAHVVGAVPTFHQPRGRA